MATFRLDLHSWEWGLLRQQRPSPSARRSTVAAASPQVCLYSCVGVQQPAIERALNLSNKSRSTLVLCTTISKGLAACVEARRSCVLPGTARLGLCMPEFVCSCPTSLPFS